MWKFPINSCLHLNDPHNLCLFVHLSCGLWWVSLTVSHVEKPSPTTKRKMPLWGWHPRVLQHLELPMLTTRWHSCIESKKKRSSIWKSKTGLAMRCFSYLCCWSLKPPPATLQHALTSLSVLLLGVNARSGFCGSYRLTAFILARTWFLSHRGEKPRGALWMFLRFTTRTFGLMLKASQSQLHNYNMRFAELISWKQLKLLTVWLSGTVSMNL